jgi:hypothetical protein
MPVRRARLAGWLQVWCAAGLVPIGVETEAKADRP